MVFVGTVSGLALIAGLSARWIGGIFLGLVLLLAGGWIAVRFLRQLLWRVGRRLAFTYFLVGVLPLPMGAFLVLVGAYLAGGLFLGHLFRESVDKIQREVEVVADLSRGRTRPQENWADAEQHATEGTRGKHH